MRKAFTANELAAFRRRPSRTKYYLAVHRPASVFSSKIKTTPVTYPVSALNIDTAFDVGTKADATKNQTIWVGTIAGASDEGKIRLRGPVSGSVVPVAESGSGLIRYTAGNFVTVMDEFRPWPKHARYDSSASQWRMDYDVAYNNELESGKYGPLLVMGPPEAKFLGPNPAQLAAQILKTQTGQDLILEFGDPLKLQHPPTIAASIVTASFVGTSTQFVGTTINTTSWIFPNGTTATTIGSEDAPTTKDFTSSSPSGSYVRLQVTDSGGVSALSRRLLYVFDDRSQPARVQFGEITGGLKTGGYTTQIRALTGTTVDDFPEGAEILIFEEASYGGLASTIGGNYPFRNHVVFRGWITDELATINPFTGEVSFTAVGTQGILDKGFSYDSFSAFVDSVSGASEWIEAENLSVDRAAIKLAKHQSTVSEVTDFHLASGLGTSTISFQELPQNTTWKQFKANIRERGLFGTVAADMQGNIWSQEDAQISGGSATLPVAMHIRKGDKRDTTIIPHLHIDTNAETEMYGIATIPAGSNYRGESTSVIPVGGESPGDVAGYFGRKREHAKGLAVDSQDRIITWAGNWRAKQNNPYPAVTMPLAGNIKLDAVPQSRVTTTLSATDVPNIRATEWTNKEFLTHTTTITYNNDTGVAQTTIGMEAVVDGKGGSAITFPRADQIVSLPPPDPPPPPTPEGPGGSLLTANDGAGVYQFGSWSARNGTLTGANIKDFYLWKDPHGPGVFKTNLGKIYRSENTGVAGVTWTSTGPSQNPPGGTTASADFIWGEGNKTAASQHVALARQNVSGTWNSWLAVTEDNGTNWNYAQIAGGAAIGTSVSVYNASTILSGASAEDISHVPDYSDTWITRPRSLALLSNTEAMGIFIDTLVGGSLFAFTIDIDSATSLDGHTFYNVTNSQSQRFELRGINTNTAVAMYQQFAPGSANNDISVRALQSNGAGSITMGAEQLFASDDSNYQDIARLSTTEFLGIHSDNNAQLQARRGTVSGTTITLNPEYNLGMGAWFANGVSIDALDATTAVATAHGNQGTADSGIAWLIDVQGTSLVNHGPSAFVQTQIENQHVAALDASKFAIFYKNNASADRGEVVIGEMVQKSPTGSLTFGSAYVWETGNVGWGAACRLSDTKALVVYDTGSTSATHAKILTITGTCVDVGPATGEEIAAGAAEPLGHSIQPIGSNSALVFARDPTGASVRLAARVLDIATGTGTEAKATNLSIDNGGSRVYVTYSDGTNLKLGAYELPGLASTSTIDLGAGTIAQQDGNSQIAYTKASKRTGDKAFVYGRMSAPGGLANDPVHIIKTTDIGTTFTAVLDDWGADHAGALDLNTSDRIFAARNQPGDLAAIYMGLITPVVKTTVSYNVRPGGMFLSKDNYLLTSASSNQDPMVEFLQSPYTASYDLTTGYPTSVTGGVTGITIV